MCVLRGRAVYLFIEVERFGEIGKFIVVWYWENVGDVEIRRCRFVFLEEVDVKTDVVS